MLEILCDAYVCKKNETVSIRVNLVHLCFYLYFDGRLGTDWLKKKLTLPLWFYFCCVKSFLDAGGGSIIRSMCHGGAVNQQLLMCNMRVQTQPCQKAKQPVHML